MISAVSATLCADRRGRSALVAAPCEFAKCPMNPLRDRACRSALAAAPCKFVACELVLEVVAWFARLPSESRGRGFDSRLDRGNFSRQKSQL